MNPEALNPIGDYLATKPHIVSYSQRGPSFTIATRCLACNKVSRISVHEDELLAWATGTFAQDAFPTLNVSEREMLISGLDNCFDDITDLEDD